MACTPTLSASASSVPTGHQTQPAVGASTVEPTFSKGSLRAENNADLSCFDMLNEFRRRLFLNRDWLLKHVTQAVKSPSGEISWVTLVPEFHSMQLKACISVISDTGRSFPIALLKRTMFVYFLEVISAPPSEGFFALSKGESLFNRAGREKRRLAKKRSRAAKRERLREEAKLANQKEFRTKDGLVAFARPSNVADSKGALRICPKCEQGFNSRKTLSKHSCTGSSKAKIVTAETAVSPEVAAKRERRRAARLLKKQPTSAVTSTKAAEREDTVEEAVHTVNVPPVTEESEGSEVDEDDERDGYESASDDEGEVEMVECDCYDECEDCAAVSIGIKNARFPKCANHRPSPYHPTACFELHDPPCYDPEHHL